MPESGILRFFLFDVFSKLSYPSAEEAVEPGGGGAPLPADRGEEGVPSRRG